MQTERCRDNRRPIESLEHRNLVDKARGAAADLIRPESTASLYDGGDRWFVEFVPPKNVLGGGARVSIAKDDLRILAIVFSQ